MKTVRKFLATALALIMTFALGTTVFAAEETYSITINNATAGHTYEAYQIFAGDLFEKDNTKVLSNIVWGTGVDSARIKADKVFGDQTAEQVAAALKTEADAKAFAQKVAPYLKNHTDSTFADGKYTISGLEAGYYLVKDQNDSLNDKDDFYTAYIMEVVGDVEATPKGNKPTLDKQVKEGQTWGNATGKQIGDTVEFRTVSTVPDTTNYTSYTYTISDTMSAGLTSNVSDKSTVTIKVNDTTVLEEKYYTVTATGNTFSVNIDILNAIKDGKMQAGNELYTYYSGVLNENAEVYDDGKENNAAHLEYSNNPNDSSDKGTTPPSNTYVWTFKMSINKVDGNKNSLTGAKFVLSKNGALKVSDLNCNDEGIPAVTTDLIGLVKESEGVYRVAKSGEANVTYVIDAGNPTIKGLDDGVEYYLYETKAPAGFNLLKAPVKFVISATYSESGAQVTAVTVKVNDGEASTNLTTDVVNNAGSTLPSTGGIGTTIFFVLGGLLVVVAGVLFVTKKRMSRSK